MKTPRITDFDPNAASEPQLGSPLDNMPRIERPRPSEPVRDVTPTNDSRTGNAVPGTGYQVPSTGSDTEQVVPAKRRIVRRRPFDIYEDQYEILKRLAEAERIAGKEGGMSAIVRQGIDMYLATRGNKKT